MSIFAFLATCRCASLLQVFCVFYSARLSEQKSGNTAHKTVKISNFGQKFVAQARLVCNIFYEILSVSTRLQELLSF